MTSRRSLLQATAAGLVVALPLPALAGSDLTFIVPLGAGGALDRLARRVAKHLPAVSNYSVSVENLPIRDSGDGYKDFLARPADGTTVLSWFLPGAANYGSGFRLDDLAIINVQEIEPPILAARSDLGWRSVADFVAEARQRPGEFRIGGGGNLLVAIRQFEALGIQVRVIDYPSGGKARAGLLRGEIDLTLGSLTALKKMGDAVTALAIMAPRRLRLWPEIPTIQDSVAFADAKPIFGSAYRFFAVRKEVRDSHPDVFRELVSAFERLTMEHEPFREDSGGRSPWFGPNDSADLVSRAHAQFIELKKEQIKPASYSRP